ncbi:MAG: hypothetical protein ACTSRP_20345 [Candidatus Helarchaeota archaeon]
MEVRDKVKIYLVIVSITVLVFGIFYAIFMYLSGHGIYLTYSNYIIVLEFIRLYFWALVGGGLVGLNYWLNAIHKEIANSASKKNYKEVKRNCIYLNFIYLGLNILLIISPFIFPSYRLIPPYNSLLYYFSLDFYSGFFYMIMGGICNIVYSILIFIYVNSRNESLVKISLIIGVVGLGLLTIGFIFNYILSIYNNIVSIVPLLNVLIIPPSVYCLIILFMYSEEVEGTVLRKGQEIEIIGVSREQEVPQEQEVPRKHEAIQEYEVPSPTSQETTIDKQKIDILTEFKRARTNADHHERWALMFGKYPYEKEDYIGFNEINIESEQLYPNSLHLKISTLIENLGYRIVENRYPLEQDIKERFPVFGMHQLKGCIKGEIKKEKKTSKSINSIIYQLVLAICFSIGFGVLLFVLIYLSPIILILLYLYSILIGIDIGLLVGAVIFYILFFKNLAKIDTKSLGGYSRIYVLENGYLYYGSQSIREEENNTSIRTFKPQIKTELIVSIAGSVKNMSIDNLLNDIAILKEKINNIITKNDWKKW